MAKKVVKEVKGMKVKDKPAKKTKEAVKKLSPVRLMQFVEFTPTFTDVSEAMNNAYNHEDVELDAPREVKLRASSLPTCPLILAKKILENENEKEEAMMHYYTSIGTTFHEHIQYWIGKSGKVLGDWKCKRCGHEIKDTVHAPCPKCKSVRLEYVEYEVRYRELFSGHIDGVFLHRDKTETIYDYKSSSIRAITEKKYVPVTKHFLQLGVYAAIRTLQGRKVRGISVIYGARDTPTQFQEYHIAWTPKLQKTFIAYLDRLVDSFAVVLKQLKKDSPNFNKIYAVKMCDTFDYYEREMQPFFGMDGCPLARICFNQEGTVNLLQRLKE